MTTLVTAGSIYDPPEMTALAGLTGGLIRSGGTETLKPDVLDAELEFMASAIEAGSAKIWDTLHEHACKKS